MQIHRFFLYGRDLASLSQGLSQKDPAWERLPLVEDDLIKQIRSVLRLGSGDLIHVLDNFGNLFELEIQSVERDKVWATIKNHIPENKTRKFTVEVAQSLIKGQRFEWCLEKLTELGADRIVPIISERCVIKTDGTAKENRLHRWQSIAKEAAEQSERNTMPDIVAPQTLPEYMQTAKNTANHGLQLICAERDQRQPLRSFLEKIAAEGKPKDIDSIEKISILVGPEGGFTDSELAHAKNQGWEPVSLGSRILRSDTASISAIIQIASILDF